MKLRLLLPVFLIVCCNLAAAQSFRISGVLVDSSSHSAIPGAQVTLTYIRDSIDQFHTSSDAKGQFVFTISQGGTYRLTVNRIGFRELRQRVFVKDDSTNLGTLAMVQRPVEIQGIDVNAELPTVSQKKDTVEMNAGAFKTNKDATTEDLVTKMPGITIDKTTVKAQGEDVKQVLLDGRPFFGDDPTASLRNLPAEMVDKVQVYDKLSDQAELTGFDDGQTTKTMNIITRADRRSGKFGKANGGYGNESRYESGASINSFSGNERLTLLLMSNNTNQQNFSMQDILGTGGGPSRLGAGGGMMMMRGGHGGGGGGGGPRGGGMAAFQNGSLSDFIVGQQNGLNTTHSGGLNFTDVYGEETKVSGSYFVSRGNNNNQQALQREYFLSQPSSQQYDEINNAESHSTSHRANVRIEYPFDSSNALILTPRLNVQMSNSLTGIDGANLNGDTLINRRNSLSSSDGNGYTISNGATFRHKFETPGRTISADLSLSANKRNSTSGLLSVITAYPSPSATRSDTTDQQGENISNSRSLSTNLAYTEPLGRNHLVQANYGVTFTRNTADKHQFDLDSANGRYDLLNPALSTAFENGYRTQREGVSYRTRGENYNITAGVSLQQAHLTSDYTLPAGRSLTKDFASILPMAQLQYRLNQSSMLRVIFQTSTQAPSITQLQSAIDNSNPTMLTSGNADLKQSTAYSINARYNTADMGSSTSFFLFANASTTNDYIGTATYLFDNDTTLADGTRLPGGTQLQRNINMNGYQNVNGFAAYGFPVGLLKSNLNLNAGLGYSRTPGLINGVINSSRSYSFMQGVVLGSNIGQDVDFTVSYNSTISVVRNDANPILNTTSYRHQAGVRGSFTVLDGIVLRSDLGHQLYSGYNSSADQQFLIWNAGIGKKFLADQSLELSVNAYDILNQNSRVIRNVTDSYVEDVQPQVLTRYFLVTLTYTLRNTAGFGDGQRGGRWGHDHVD